MKSGTAKLTVKDAWSSKLLDELDKINQNSSFTDNRSDMIHKISILDESFNVYNIRLENILTLGDKLVERIINVKKNKIKQNKDVNTISKPEDIILEQRPRIFYDDFLKRWNGKGDTILRNITTNYEGKILIDREKDQSKKYLFNNEKVSKELIDKLKEIDFKNLHICPSLVESQTESVFEDDFIDDNLEINIDNEQFIDNFADQFNDFGLDDAPIENFKLKEEIKFENLEPTPFNYHRAWAGPSQWKFTSIRKKFKNKKENKKRKFDFLESFNKNDILSDKRPTLFKEEAILERRKISKNLKKDFGFKVEDLYTYCLITSMDCFIEKREKISNSQMLDHQNYNDQSFARNESIHDPFNHEKENFNPNNQNKEIGDITSENIQLPEILSLRKPKAQKRINMKDLQSKIKSIIEDNRKVNTQKGITFKKIHQDLGPEITWQYMVVAILEMANQGLQLSEENSENVVL